MRSAVSFQADSLQLYYVGTLLERDKELHRYATGRGETALIPVLLGGRLRIMADFAKLHVWRKAHALALNVHRVATGIRGPAYGSLRNQMVRAAMSIPTNIVEGRGQKSERDFARFLGYAVNSSSELEYHLVVARDTKAITKNDFTSLTDQTKEVRRMLYGLIKSLAPSPIATR